MRKKNATTRPKRAADNMPFLDRVARNIALSMRDHMDEADFECMKEREWRGIAGGVIDEIGDAERAEMRAQQDSRSMESRNRRIAYLEREFLKKDAEIAQLKVTIEEIGMDASEKALVSAVKSSGLIDGLIETIKKGAG